MKSCGNSPWCEPDQRCGCDEWEAYEKSFKYKLNQIKEKINLKIRKIMKNHKSHYVIGSLIKYFIITLIVFFLFVIFSDIADKALERNTRFDCWKLQQYATTYEGFWITEEEDIACRTVNINVEADVK